MIHRRINATLLKLQSDGAQSGAHEVISLCYHPHRLDQPLTESCTCTKGATIGQAAKANVDVS